LKIRGEAFNHLALQYFSLLKKPAILLYISFLIRESAKIPPFPPLKKGGEGGFKKALSKS
jgi:hypothetical protein